MARGKKYSDEVREAAMAELATNNNMTNVAVELGIPKTTLATWKKEAESDENFVQLRTKKKEEFVRNAWRTIEDALTLGARRVKRALEHEAELDKLIDAIDDDGDIDAKDKIALIQKVHALQLQGIRDISTYIGTIYDKQALAAGEATGRQELTGKNGGPVELATLTPEERATRIAELLARRG
jgi:transposase-like protein